MHRYILTKKNEGVGKTVIELILRIKEPKINRIIKTELNFVMLFNLFS